MYEKMLIGKVAVITGGGRGIGRAIASLFAEHGASVIVVSRNATHLNTVANEINSNGGSCLALPADVSDQSSVNTFFENVREKYDHIDILVNNAGITLERPFMDLSPADFRNLFEVNLMGVVHCTRAVLPGMMARNEGRIINFASGAGLRGLGGNSGYAASKAAVVALTHSLADELQGTGIRTNVICPGPVDTEMFRESGVRDFVLKSQATILKPREVADVALFLASDHSSGMNSQALNVRLNNRW